MRAAERAAVGSAALLVLLQWQQKRREKAWHLWIMAVYFWALAGGFGDYSDLRSGEGGPGSLIRYLPGGIGKLRDMRMYRFSDRIIQRFQDSL